MPKKSPPSNGEPAFLARSTSFFEMLRQGIAQRPREKPRAVHASRGLSDNGLGAPVPRQPAPSVAGQPVLPATDVMAWDQEPGTAAAPAPPPAPMFGASNGQLGGNQQPASGLVAAQPSSTTSEPARSPQVQQASKIPPRRVIEAGTFQVTPVTNLPPDYVLAQDIQDIVNPANAMYREQSRAQLIRDFVDDLARQESATDRPPPRQVSYRQGPPPLTPQQPLPPRVTDSQAMASPARTASLVDDLDVLAGVAELTMGRDREATSEWTHSRQQPVEIQLLEPMDVADERFTAGGPAHQLGESTEQVASLPIYTVVDSNARIRTGPPDFQIQGTHRIPQYTRVHVHESNGPYALVSGVDGTDYGWTAMSNLGTYYKDSPELQAVSLRPAAPININDAWPQERRAMAATYNRIGGLIDGCASALDIETPVVLAVWQVESRGREHTPNRAIIRFENQVLFDKWGEGNQATYDQYFQHGTRPPATGDQCTERWLCHQFRDDSSGAFISPHESQKREYEALTLATRLAGEGIALQCISIGGPQILGSQYRLIGYQTPREMYNAFQESERAHVLGFFDYIQYKKSGGALINSIRNHDWIAFALGYNGKGKEQKYGNMIRAAYEEAKQLFAGQPG